MRRQSTFDEVVVGLTEETAVVEVRRCLSCGNCFFCDNGPAVCPDNAVLKLSSAGDYEVDYDCCKGFGIFTHECPFGAIGMVPGEL